MSEADPHPKGLAVEPLPVYLSGRDIGAEGTALDSDQEENPRGSLMMLKQ